MKQSLLLLLITLVFVGCSTRPAPLPEIYSHKLPWGALNLDKEAHGEFTIRDSLGSVLTQKTDAIQKGKQDVKLDILALTGGGSRGAFGTGLLLGWKKKGDMPTFDVVTGISTGAVMAPFIFVGGESLTKVEYFYTKMSTDEVFSDSLLSIFDDGYIMNAKPLQKLFRKHFDKAFLEKVALEHKKGRRLYIGTTNIDTGELTVWDMGAIASSNRKDKYQLFSDIVYASTALPIYLPPQYMKVDVDDKSYYQMHIDGGVHSQVFMIGLLINWKEILNIPDTIAKKLDVTLYTVANRKYRQRDVYQPVEQEALDIIEAYVLTEMDLLFDRSIYRLYTSCKKKGIKFRISSIPDKMKNIVVIPTEFHPEPMTKLFNVGYMLGLDGIQWKKEIKISEYEDSL